MALHPPKIAINRELLFKGQIVGDSKAQVLRIWEIIAFSLQILNTEDNPLCAHAFMTSSPKTCLPLCGFKLGKDRSSFIVWQYAFRCQAYQDKTNTGRSFRTCFPFLSPTAQIFVTVTIRKTFLFLYICVTFGFPQGQAIILQELLSPGLITVPSTWYV